jgi:L-threonylcarbamoyladenylate synthase
VRWARELAMPRVSASPGLHPRHNAPRTPFYVLEPGAARPSGRGRVIEMPSNRRTYAATLYAELHQADKEGWDWIAVERPPETPEWSGILDRLTRASTPQE